MAAAGRRGLAFSFRDPSSGVAWGARFGPTFFGYAVGPKRWPASRGEVSPGLPTVFPGRGRGPLRWAFELEGVVLGSGAVGLSGLRPDFARAPDSRFDARGGPSVGWFLRGFWCQAPGISVGTTWWSFPIESVPVRY